MLFLAITCMVMLNILSVLNYKSTGGGGGWQNFYDMPKKTADVVFFGSSHAHCTFDHGFLWDEYGIAGYTLSAGAQMIDCTYYFVKEAIEVHKPKVVVVEVWGAIHDQIVNSDESVYRNTLGLRWSKNHWEFVNDLVDHMERDSDYRKRLLAKIPVIHSRYAEVTKEDFENIEPYMRGYRGSFERTVFETPNIIPAEEVAALDARSEEYLRKIIDLVKESDTELVLAASPYLVSETDQRRFNRISQIAGQEGVPMINFNHLYDEMELDYSLDFRDEGHLNNYGARKVTSYLAGFLRENYELSDKRGEEKYKLWDLNSRFLKGKEAEKVLWDAVSIHDYLKVVSELKEYVVILMLNGNHTAAGDIYFPELERMGIDYDSYLAGGVWIFENGIQVEHIPGKEYKRDFEINKNSIYLKSEISMAEDGNNREEVEIVMDNRNYVLAENGVNILVYDPQTDLVIDSAGTDIFVNFDMIRADKRL